MKPFHFFVGLGVVLIIALGGFYYYMNSTLPFDTSASRGVPEKALKKAEAVKKTKKTVKKAAVPKKAAAPKEAVAPKEAAKAVEPPSAAP